jgi:hypothetical protein
MQRGFQLLAHGLLIVLAQGQTRNVKGSSPNTS